MAISCPNKALPEWKQLVDKVGETAAFRMWMEAGEDLNKALSKLDPNVYPVTEKLDKIKSLSSKVLFDDSPDPVTGEPRHNYRTKDGKSLISVSEALEDIDVTKYRGDDAGIEYSQNGSKVHKIFEDIAEGISRENTLKYMADNGIQPEFYEAVQNIVNNLKSQGHVLSEATLVDIDNGIAGKTDIIVLKSDGTVDIYDIKTAHKTPRFAKTPDEPIWNPVEHFDGYKARRYPTQTKFYAKLVEKAIGHPVSNTFIIPIEITYKNDDVNQGFDNLNILRIENTAEYGYDRKANKLVDEYFGEAQPEMRPELNSNDDSDDFMFRLINRKTNEISGKSLEQQANEVLTYLRNRGNSKYYNNGKNWVLLRGNTEAEWKNQIINEYLSVKESSRRDIPEAIRNYLETGEDKFLSSKGKVYENLRTIVDKYKGRDVDIYNLSEIKGFSNKINWIVVQGKDGDGNPTQEYDLLYLSNESLEEKLVLNKRQGWFSSTLFRNYYTPDEAKYLLGSKLKPTLADSKKVEATMIAMKMKESFPEATFERILIGSTKKSSIHPVAVSMKETLPVLEKLFKGGRMEPPSEYTSLIENKETFKPENYQRNYARMYMDMVDANLTHNANFGLRNELNDYIQNGVAKSSLLNQISREITRLKDEPNSKQEAYILSELYYQLKKITTELQPISSFDRYVSMPTNVKNTVIQDLVKVVKNGINRIRDRFWNNYKKPYIEYQKRLFKESGLFDTLKDYTISDTTKYYKPLFKTNTFKVETENGIQEKQLHQFEFLDEGSDEFNKLSKAQQEFIIKTNDVIQEAAQEAGIKWQRGRLPLVKATFMNKVYRALSGNSSQNVSNAYKDALTKMTDSFEENFGLGEDKGQSPDAYLTNLFTNQANTDVDNAKRLDMLGFKEGGYVDAELYDQYETNVEVITDLFKMNAIRVDEFKSAADAFNTAETLFQYQKSDLFADVGLNVEWVEVWRQAMLHNRDTDSGSIANKTVRTTNKIASAFTIGFKPATAIVAALGQQLSAFSQSVANSFSSKATFTAKTWLKAGAYISNPLNYNKVSAIMETYGMYNLDISNLVNGYRRYGNKSMFRSKWLYSLLNAGDWLSRSQILIAQMMHDGSLDAYDFKDGVLTYNEDADPRFKGEDGKLIKNTIKQQLEEQGGLDENGRMLRGYDDNLANKMKFNADEVIGGFDRETKGLYSFNALGKLLGLFKTWLPARLNKGFDTEFNSDINGDYTIETDENGNKQVVWKGDQMEGIFHSLKAMMFNLKQLRKNGETKPLTEKQKENLRRMISDIAIMGVVMLVTVGIIDDDDKTSTDDNTASILKRSLQDLVATYNVMQLTELLYTPIAVTFAERTLKQIYNIFAGIPDPNDNTLERIVDTAPIARHYKFLYEDMLEED